MNNDTKDMEEAAEELLNEMPKKEGLKSPEKDLPEAPISITIKGYYKGFSVLLTKRTNDEMLGMQVDGIMKTIDKLVDLGFKPSWADDTNKANGNGVQGKIETPKVETESGGETAPTCPYHHKLMTKRHGQYGDFWACGTKLDNGEWCKYKPPKQ